MHTHSLHTRLARIPLKKGSRKKFEDLVAYMKEHYDEYQFESSQKGYWWDSVFYEEGTEQDTLWITSKSPAWDMIKGDQDIETTHFRKVYDVFRQECWLVERLEAEHFMESIWDPYWEIST
ncbi:MAG: hypothetical protein KDD52_00695 [Bdellovibrionales bacterium]|nr:hypothetical protein [Bdellovibrionales bacterium]